MNFNCPIFLASNSPRRQQLLASLGIQFEVKVIPVEESYPDQLSPMKVPNFLARKKAEAVAVQEKDALVIGADTVVILHNEILGKPENLDQARSYLQQLSGCQHEVVTGVCLKFREQLIVFKDITKVRFAPLSDSEITHYINTCNPLDKAGAYGIQEWIGMIGVAGIKGSYFNVVGLPVQKLYRELKNLRSKI